MEIANINVTNSVSTYPSMQRKTDNQVEIQQETDEKNQTEEFAANDKSKEALMKISDELNKFLDSLNTDIQFKLHEKTKKLIVQVISIKDHEVLREFPPEEFLDTIAKIREYVGMLIDKKV